MPRTPLSVLVALLLAGALPSAASAADTTPPSIAITTPPEGAVYHQYQSVASSYTCTDEPGGSGLATQGAGGCFHLAGGFSSTSGGPVDTSTPGAATFTVHAEDVAGNRSSLTHSYTVLADTTAPTISVTAPANGSTFDQGQVVPTAFTCTDEVNGSGIAPVDPFRNPFNTVGGCSINLGPFRAYGASGESLNTFSLGAQTATITAVDRAGNVATQTISYTVVVGPPVVFIATPGEGAVYTPGQVVTASYACSEGGFGGPAASCIGTVADGAPIDTSPGAHSFTVTAVGSTGRTSSVTHHYTVGVTDTTAPVAAASASPGGMSAGPVTVTVAATDPASPGGVAGSGVVSVTTSVNGATPVTTAGASTTLSFTAAGTYTITYSATDAAGNTSVAKTITVVIDQTAPTGSYTGAAQLTVARTSAGSDAGPTVLRGTAADDRGVTRVRVTLASPRDSDVAYSRTWEAQCTCGATVTPVAWSLNLGALTPRPPAGVYVTTIAIEDQAGNVRRIAGPRLTFT